MTGGEVFDVRHHDFVTVSDYHAVVVLKDEQGACRAHLAAIMNISPIETPRSVPQPERSGENGQEP